MTGIPRRDSSKAIPALWAGLLLAALAIRIPVLFQPLEHLVTVLPDDAFYYFEVAKRVGLGEGLTFDGTDLADGFQPLWMLILVTLAWLPKMAMLKAALAVGIALHLATAACLGRGVFLLSRSHVSALLAAAIYTFNRWSGLSSVNGLETALTSALFSVCLLLVAKLHLTEAQQRDTWRNAGWLGAAVALLFLARTDQIFYCGAFLALSLALVPRSRWIFRVAAIGLSIALPWFVWHWWLSGNPLPSSGTAQPLIMRNLAELHGTSADRGWISFRGFFTGGIFSFTGFERRLLVPLLAAAGLITAITWRKATPALRFGILAFLSLGLGGFALGVVHTYLRWYPRTWYFDQYILLVALYLALALALARDLIAHLASHSPTHARSWSRVQVVALVLCLLPLAAAARTAFVAITGGNYLHQARVLEAARWIERHADNAPVVAGWNSGITAFALEQPVVNLDGAISASTLPYLKQRDLSQLLCHRQVEFIADHQGDLERFKPFLPGYDSYAVEPPTRIPASTADIGDAFLVQRVSRQAWSNGCPSL